MRKEAQELASRFILLLQAAPASIESKNLQNRQFTQIINT
jgi:hypothetical protein